MRIDRTFLKRTFAAAVFLAFAVVADVESSPRDNTFNQSLSLDHIKGGRVASPLKGGLTAVYTIEPVLQSAMENYFRKFRVPYGVFVAIEPDSGKILALVEHSDENPRARHLSLRATYPAASIFKLVTAAAAIEEGAAGPDTSISYRGNAYRFRPRNWVYNPKRDKFKMTLGEALAKSNNAVFAKVALRWLDVPMLIGYGERFQFNRPIPFELPVQVSQMKIEGNGRDLAKSAAGFGEVTLSPLHAALIGAAIANDGVMMAPCLIDFIRGPDGGELYACTPKAFATAISPETARSIRKMMAMTVLDGTSRKAFRFKKREASLRGLTIGGKTGSLSGDNPKGKYSWFVGMAPVDRPEIAVAALVINRSKWKIKATDVAKAGLASYFEENRVRVSKSGLYPKAPTQMVR